MRESAAEWNPNLEDGCPCASPRILTKEEVKLKTLIADYALEMDAKNKMPELWSTHLGFRTMEYTPWLPYQTKNLYVL